MHTYAYSCLVDDVDAHPYKAQILIHTLHALGLVPLENIFVHITDRVSQDIVNSFRALGVQVIGVKPYLDRKYCNKLRQLDYFFLTTNSLIPAFFFWTSISQSRSLFLYLRTIRYMGK